MLFPCHQLFIYSLNKSLRKWEPVTMSIFSPSKPLRSTRRTQKISAGRTIRVLVHQLLPFFCPTCGIGWLFRNTESVPPKISKTEKSEIRTYHSLLGKRLLCRSFRRVRFTCAAPGPQTVTVVLFADWVFFGNLGPTIARQWCSVFWYTVVLRQWGGSDVHFGKCWV